MRILSGILVFLLTNLSVNCIAPNLGPAAAIGTPITESKKKTEPIGTSSINRNKNKDDDDRSDTSVSSFSSSAKKAKVASVLHKAQIEKSLLNSLSRREEKENAEEKKEKKEVRERDNTGHNKSKKIKVVSSKKSIKIISKKILKPKKDEDSDDEGEDSSDSEEDSSEGSVEDSQEGSLATNNVASQAIRKQVLQGVVYFGGSYFLKKVDMKNKKILRLSRIIFALYILGSQLLFYIIKNKIMRDNDETLVDKGGPLSLKGLASVIPIADKMADKLGKRKQNIIISAVMM